MNLAKNPSGKWGNLLCPNTFVAVGVGLGGAAIAAGTQVYIANDQKKTAKKAQSQAQVNNEALYGKKFEAVPYNDRVGTDEGYGREVMSDVLSNTKQTLPDIFRIAARVNATNEAERKKRTGGAFQDTIMQEGANLEAMQKGNVPQDVIDQVNRMMAEHVGGAFDPSNPGFGGNSATANNAARHLGLTSLDIMKTGMSMAPAWRANVDSFIYKPQNVMSDFINPVAAITGDANRLQMARDEAEYISANNITRAEAMPNPGTVGSFRDSLLLGAMENRADANMAQALSGLVTSAGTATFNAYKQNYASPTASPTMSPYQPNPIATGNLSDRPPGMR